MPGPISYPGVYVDEVPSAVRSIAGVATSVALFAGWTTRGPTDIARHVAASRSSSANTAGSTPGRCSVTRCCSSSPTAAAPRGSCASPAAKGRALVPADAGFRRALLRRFGPGSATDRIDLYNLVCVPGLTDAATLATLQAECRRRRAFLIIDADPAATVEHMASNGTLGLTGPDGSYSALYFPWVQCADPLRSGAARAFPPCGFVAGLMARTDDSRGVWKAPAGREATAFRRYGSRDQPE